MSRDAFTYVSSMMRIGIGTGVLGILFTPLIFLLSDRSITFLFYFIFLLFISSLVAKYNAIWRFSQIRRYLKDYSEYGSFWAQKRYEFLRPKVIWKWFQFGSRTLFVHGEWKFALLVNAIYVFLAIFPLFVKIFHFNRNYGIIFIFLLWYVVYMFHNFFLFLNWKYKISKKIKEEYGFEYKDLII